MNLFKNAFAMEPTKFLMEVLLEENRVLNIANKAGLQSKAEILDILIEAQTNVDKYTAMELTADFTMEMRDAAMIDIITIARDKVVEIDEMYADENNLADMISIAEGGHSALKDTIERTEERDAKLALKLNDGNFLRNGDVSLNKFFNILRPSNKYDNTIMSELHLIRTGKSTAEGTMDKYGKIITEVMNSIYNVLAKFAPHDSALAEFRQAIHYNKAQRIEFVKALDKAEGELKVRIQEEIENIDVNLRMMESLDAKQLTNLSKEIHRNNLGESTAKIIDLFNKILLVAIRPSVPKYKLENAEITKDEMVVIHTVTATFVAEALLTYTKSAVGSLGPNLANSLLYTFLSNKYLYSTFMKFISPETKELENDAEVVKNAVENLEDTAAELMGVDKELPITPLPKCVGDAEGLIETN